MDSNRTNFSQRFTSDSQNMKRKLDNLVKPNSSHTSTLQESANRLRNLSGEKVKEIEEASQQLKKLEDQLKSDQKINETQKQDLNHISQQSDVPMSELEKIMKQMNNLTSSTSSSTFSSSFSKGNLQEMSEKITRDTKKMEEVLQSKGKTVEQQIQAKQVDIKEATANLASVRSVVGEASDLVKRFSTVPTDVEKKLSGMVGLVEGLKKLQSSLTDQTLKQRDTTKLMSYLHNGYTSKHKKSKDVWSSSFLDQVVQLIKEKDLKLQTLFQEGAENKSPLEFVDSVLIDNRLYVLAIKSPKAESSTFIYKFDLQQNKKEVEVIEVKTGCIPYEMIVKDGSILISACLPMSESSNVTDSLLGGKLNELKQKPRAAVLRFDLKTKETEIVRQFETNTIPFKLLNDHVLAIKKMDEVLNDFVVEVIDFDSKQIIWKHSTNQSKEILLDLFMYQNNILRISKSISKGNLYIRHHLFEFVFDVIPKYHEYREAKLNEKNDLLQILFENDLVEIDLESNQIVSRVTKSKSILEFNNPLQIDDHHQIIGIHTLNKTKFLIGYIDTVPNELFSRQSFVKFF